MEIILLQCLEMCLYQPLRTEFRFECITAKTIVLQEQALHQFIVITKYFPQNIFRDIWPGISVMVEPGIAAMKFADMYRYGRNKMSHDAFHRIHWYAPDTE